MPWRLEEPGHQRDWYCQVKPAYSVSNTRRINTILLDYSCHRTRRLTRLPSSCNKLCRSLSNDIKATDGVGEWWFKTMDLCRWFSVDPSAQFLMTLVSPYMSIVLSVCLTTPRHQTVTLMKVKVLWHYMHLWSYFLVVPNTSHFRIWNTLVRRVLIRVYCTRNTSCRITTFSSPQKWKGFLAEPWLTHCVRGKMVAVCRRHFEIHILCENRFIMIRTSLK